jgi:hypothetical protein
MFENPYTTITDAQEQFIRSQGAVLDDQGWTVDYRENLFARLHPESMADFKDAGEISESSGGRIAAPHSSTALTINMFDVWRGQDLAALSDALGFDAQRIVGYEKPHDLCDEQPKGLDHRWAANLDIELVGAAETPVALEVKLREPYGSVNSSFAKRYFATPGLWDGLPDLKELAMAIRDGDITFTTLHAAQLIKHTVGLTRSYGRDFVLGYLWVYVPSTVGDDHVRELAEFSAVARNDITFMSVTVAELLDRIDPERADPAWLAYMTDRYVMPRGR